MEGFFNAYHLLGLVVERRLMRIPPEALPLAVFERLCWAVIPMCYRGKSVSISLRTSSSQFFR
jgi:hypothetical protein